MSTEEDECDSSSPLTVASQADITSYLRTRADQITGLDISMSDIDDIEDDDDDDETSMDGSLLTRFAQVPSPKTIHRRKARSVASTSSYLSQSCFASISPNKASASDDLTELKWLNSFKFKDHLINQPSKEKPLDSAIRHEYRVSEFINDLKTHHTEIQPASYAVWIFLACYSMRDDKRTPWSLTMKQLYEYIQSNIKSAPYQRGWKNLLRKALLTVPCFIQKKDETVKARSLWTIDPYYRPSLIRAYNCNASLATQKSPVEGSTPPTTDQVTTTSPSLVNHFPPKATVKTKALPRLYERLCGAKSLIEDEADFKLAHSSDEYTRKRPRSMSLLEARSTLTSNEVMANESSSTRTRKSKKQGKTLTADHSPIESTLSKESPIVTPSPSLDHSYSNRVEPSIDDERDGGSSVHSKELDVKSMGVNHRRKPSPPKKRVPLVIPSHRANTRISRRIIEQDLRLLHQSALASSSDQQPLDLSKDSSH